jgi:hypothetical protein
MIGPTLLVSVANGVVYCGNALQDRQPGYTLDRAFVRQASRPVSALARAVSASHSISPALLLSQMEV